MNKIKTKANQKNSASREEGKRETNYFDKLM